MSSPQTVWAYRTWIGNLAKRELAARHKRSALGWLWSLINPAATLAIYTVVFGTFMRVQPPVAGNGTTQNFALYLFIGLVIWNFFNGVVNGSMASLQAAGGMLNKVYFPPESPALAFMAATLVQLAIESVILVIILLALGNVSWTLVLLPVLVVLLCAFSIGLGLLVSVYNIIYRDVAYLVGIFMQILFYATPIIYTIDQVPEDIGGVPVRWLVQNLNPVAEFVSAARDLLYGLQMPAFTQWASLVVWSVGTLALGWWAFGRRAAFLIEEL